MFSRPSRLWPRGASSRSLYPRYYGKNVIGGSTGFNTYPFLFLQRHIQSNIKNTSISGVNSSWNTFSSGELDRPCGAVRRRGSATDFSARVVRPSRRLRAPLGPISIAAIDFFSLGAFPFQRQRSSGPFRSMIESVIFLLC